MFEVNPLLAFPLELLARNKRERANQAHLEFSLIIIVHFHPYQICLISMKAQF